MLQVLFRRLPTCGGHSTDRAVWLSLYRGAQVGVKLSSGCSGPRNAPLLGMSVFSACVISAPLSVCLAGTGVGGLRNEYNNRACTLVREQHERYWYETFVS